MPVDSENVFCGNCGMALKEDPHGSEERIPCPSCGSPARKFQVNIKNTITMKSKLGMKARHAGGGKPFIEQIHGDDLQRKTGKWMKLSRVIDRENDHYHETVTDPKTSEIVHECKEPLSQHRSHGAAKLKNKSKNKSG